MKDLFQHHEEMPKPLYDICIKWEEKFASDGLNYKDCNEWLKEVNAIGYTFDYGLDAEPYDQFKVNLTTIKDIKQAVDDGLQVRCGNDLYHVIKGKRGEYLIHVPSNGYTIGLHGKEGTKYEHKLNADNFYIKTND